VVLVVGAFLLLWLFQVQVQAYGQQFAMRFVFDLGAWVGLMVPAVGAGLLFALAAAEWPPRGYRWARALALATLPLLFLTFSALFLSRTITFRSLTPILSLVADPAVQSAVAVLLGVAIGAAVDPPRKRA
jgi:hypothetical protein